MTLAIKLLIRVVKRREQNGEEVETVLMDYPKLTEEEKAQIRRALHL